MSLLRADYLRSLRDLCIARWTALEAIRRQEQGVRYDSASHEATLAALSNSRTVGEVVSVLDSVNWGRTGVMHLLVEAAGVDLEVDEFAALDGAFRYNDPQDTPASGP